MYTLSDHHIFFLSSVEGNQNDTHAKRIAEFAVEAVAAAGKVMIDEDDPSAGRVHIRVGFHTGQVVSNVIGSLNPRFGLFGDTMNTASRMEHLSKSGKIQCSEVSAKLLKDQAPEFPLLRRGKVAVKGKGDMITYWIGNSTLSEDSDRGSADGKKVQNKSQIIVNMDGSDLNDLADSAPTFWNSRSKKERRRLNFSSGGSSCSE
jgi:guanylate cyclase